LRNVRARTIPLSNPKGVKLMPPHKDRLTHDERLRLEAFAQAVQVTAITGGDPGRPTVQDFLNNAKRIATWIATGEVKQLP